MKRLTFIFSFYLFMLASSWAHESESTKPFEKIHAHRSLEVHAHGGWESRYFSEGRDALDGKSLWTGSVELGYDHFSGGVWYGRSSNHQYDEWQYNLSLSQELGAFEFYMGYTHLVFSKDKESDDEWSVGISYTELPIGLETSLDAYYSMDAEGSFIEWSTGKEYNPLDELTLSVSTVLGWNENYVSDGHNGLNFICLRTGAEKILTESLSLVGHGAYSWSVDQDLSLPGDQQLKDFFHLGLGVEWAF